MAGVLAVQQLVADPEQGGQVLSRQQRKPTSHELETVAEDGVVLMVFKSIHAGPYVAGRPPLMDDSEAVHAMCERCLEASMLLFDVG